MQVPYIPKRELLLGSGRVDVRMIANSLVQPGLVSESRHGDWNLVTCFQVFGCLRPVQPSSLSAPGLRCYMGRFTGSGFLSEPKRRLSQENPWAPERLLAVQPAIAARAE